MAETIEQQAAEKTKRPPTSHDEASKSARVSAAPAAKPAERSKTLPLWNVVLLDDDEHTYDYVIEMLMNLCGHSLQGSFHLARGVDRDGRGIIFTAHRELAELKLEQIRGFGTDPRVMSCRGSMTAIIEPAEG